MDFGYLMSILELYLSKEKNSKTKLNIIRYSLDKVKINFTTNDAKDTTTFFMSYDEFVELPFPILEFYHLKVLNLNL